MIFNTGCVSQERVDEAFWISAAATQSSSCSARRRACCHLKFLSCTGLVPDNLVRDVFIAAIGKMSGGIVVLALCNNACISSEMALEVFQKAASRGNDEVVKPLLSKYCFALSVKEEAMVCAARNGQLNVLKRPKTGMCWPCCGLRRQQKKNPRANIYKRVGAPADKSANAFSAWRLDGSVDGSVGPGSRTGVSDSKQTTVVVILPESRRELRAHRQPKEQRRAAHRAWLNFYASSAEPH
ncbi:hypothetical protein JG687_00014471 [Phytophthora cactorum]|uniref:Uncharacterized protein n=1 Tax=Phytophthora cactorum TaxID=29920 RepID=A0A8T1TZA5_9STRA|nr:hypothetical protein JG687_00014471 [Phytophthora cactorum]